MKKHKNPIEEAKNRLAAIPRFPEPRDVRIVTDFYFRQLKKFPDSFFTAPVVRIVGTTCISGGGESACYTGYITIRVNGKQIWRGRSYEYEGREIPILDQIFGEKALIKISEDAFVLHPEL